ncbi:DUF6197 family protein [Aureimonas psammosilenae]|uniref:DUF6197 family protein n=1 Tax=Aureimonas psammosilenae TaxID=2495496 RepID=UPI0012613847|nr:hypothetical protein [Aureimonas psammosilenae]
MNVSELQAVRDKIAQGWTQEVCARDKYGEETASWENEAVCWCLVGAAMATRTNTFDISKALGISGIAAWNDHPGRTQAEVLSRIDDAIARARSLKQEGN